MSGDSFWKHSSSPAAPSSVCPSGADMRDVSLNKAVPASASVRSLSLAAFCLGACWRRCCYAELLPKDRQHSKALHALRILTLTGFSR
ncbi:hypothetical protein AGIG_G22436 [Arapaima gigas]